MPQDFVYDKVMANLEEVKARGGPVIAVAAEGDTRVDALADDVIRIPHVEEYLAADGRDHPAAAALLSHRRAPRLRRRQAAEPGQKRDGRVSGGGILPPYCRPAAAQ